jgi:putative endonuclease
MADKQQLGAAGEAQAAQYLTSLGYAVLVRNYHTQLGEVDLICRAGEEYVFVEVKLRRSDSHGTALEAATARKLARVLAAGQEWLLRQGEAAAPYRLELVAIDGGKLEHLTDLS